MANALLEKHHNLKELEPKINKYTVLNESGNVVELWNRNPDTGEWIDNTACEKKKERVEQMKLEVERLKKQLAKLMAEDKKRSKEEVRDVN